MPARRKKNAPVEEMLEEPATVTPEGQQTPEIPAAPPATAEGTEAVVPAPDPAAPAPHEWNWPDSTERRRVPVPITDEERVKLAERLSRVVDRINAVEADKRASASSYKAQLDDLHNDMEAANDAFKNGTYEVEVVCRWYFERAVRQGVIVDDPNHKVLIRTDNGAVVLMTIITDEDRQATLILEQQEPEMTIEEMAAFLAAEGFQIVSNDPPGPDKPAFELVEMASSENRRALEASSTDEALRAAVAILKAAPVIGDDDTGDDSDDSGDRSNIIPFNPEAFTVRQAGFDARLAGINRDQSPHGVDTEEDDEWKQGWDAANNAEHAGMGEHSDS